MASSSSSSHAAPASSSRSFKYDVFLSFRGEDTRKTFVDHLYSALEQHLIGTYKDDVALPRGESIRPALFKAIEESRIAIIVFSKHYADSSWCLEELTHIMKCKEERALTVMPIFYDVDPSEVRKQKGDFGEGFAQQEAGNDRAQIWRNALVNASNIAGWEPKHVANGHESKVIKEIVDTVLGRLFPSNTEVDKDLVGMKTRLEDLKSQLEIESESVRMVGIWGVGGSGKTTLANSIYMELCHHFRGHCILENVREKSDDLSKLQENILSVIFKREVKVSSVAEGKLQIKNMLCNSNVLIVLDDVNDLDQLGALAGSHSWFGSGSRIIITTRDEHLLRTHKVDEVYHVRLLTDDEATQLFRRHAYNEKEPIEDYEALSLRVVSYAAGLPLALKVIGSFLYDKAKTGWMSTLDRLKDIPETEIVKKLKISFDGLKTVEKELFLDIACFWRNREIDKAMEILEACDFYPEIGIEVLRQKALISIVDGFFDMHDLVQEMGHYIVRGEDPNNPNNHSRIWTLKEINKMCLGDTTIENDKIEAIKIDYEYFNELEHPLQFCKIVSNLKRLRYLKARIEDPTSVEGPTFLSNELRYIHWKGYPTSSIFAGSFQPMKLVVLKLENSYQMELWKGCKHLPHLKVLELGSMRKLIRLPNFDGFPCLQKLKLYHSYHFKKIHPSLGRHRRIQYIMIDECPGLTMFPTIVRMKNLKTLEIINCPKILEFPKIRANMEGLVKLHMIGTGIKVLPSSIGEHCTNLVSLCFRSFHSLNSMEFNFHALKHLKKLSLGEIYEGRKTMRQLFSQILCGLQKLDPLEDIQIPSSIIELSNLQELDLSFNDFVSRLDFSLSQLTRLKLLNLTDCKRLRELPELPSSLTILKADGCRSITALGDCHKKCRWLSQVSLAGDGAIISDGERLLESMLEACTAIENHCMLLVLGGVETAKGFTPSLLRGNICTLQLPENWCNDFSGFLMCVVMPCVQSCRYTDMSASLSVIEETNGIDSQHVLWEDRDGTDKCTQMVYVSFGSLRQTVWWDPTYKALKFEIRGGWCLGLGVGLIEKKSKSGIMDLPTDYTSDYTPALQIKHDSTSALSISLSMIRSLFKHAL